MRLVINYNNVWRGKILEGNNSKDWFNKNRKVMRKVNKDIKKLGINSLPVSTPISDNTVLGIIYRLVGEQRKLWRVLEVKDYLNIVGKINFTNEESFISRESIALREIGNASNPAGWQGCAKKEDNIYFSDPKFYNILCFPLVCSPKELYELIINDKFGSENLKINGRIDVLKMVQSVDDKKINKLSLISRINLTNKLKTGMPGFKYRDKNIYKTLCLFAMHKCANYLKDMGFVETGIKWNKGISYRNATAKDIFGAVASGKNTVINFPMDDNWKNKTNKIEKPTGVLTINIDIDHDSAQNLKDMIEAANVGCFSVGKKGLAYLDYISIY